MKSRPIPIRIPVDLWQRTKVVAAERQMAEVEVIRTALRVYLDLCGTTTFVAPNARRPTQSEVGPS